MEKEIRPRLSEDEYSVIEEYRAQKKKESKKIIAALVNKGDSAVKEQFGLSDAELDEIKAKGQFDEKLYPKILLLDIETLPCWTRVWGLYKQRIPHTNIIKDWCVLSWVSKWLYDSEVYSDILTPEEALNHDDGRILKSIWDMLEQADIVIAHNGKKFDIRKLKARFFAHKMKPTTPFQIIDTLKESQKELATTSHRLDYLGRLISNKGKIETNYELWIGCDEGDQESLDYMLKYNIEDVFLLEEVYLELRPWIHSHPSLALHSHSVTTECPYCESTELEEAGYYITPAGRYVSIRCKECGGISRKRKSDLSYAEKESLIISTAR